MDRPLPRIFDGAMGTWYAREFRDSSQNTEAANEIWPQRIRGIHRGYIRAGAQAILTNTFALPQSEQGPDLVDAAVENARLATEGTDVRMFASLGPMPAHQEQRYSTLIDRFLDLGIREFLFETLPDLDPILPAIRHLKERDPKATVVVSFATETDGLTRGGLEVTKLVQQADQDPDIDAVGLNCLLGPAAMVKMVKTLSCQKPLLIRPNAGTPAVVSNRTAFTASPAYFAETMAELARMGVESLGGCCGTTPAHIHALAKAVEDIPVTQRKPARPETEETSMRTPEILRLFEGRRPIFVEADPPVNDEVLPWLGAVRQLKNAGADVITIADNPVGRPRADSCMLAGLVHRKEQIQVLPHIACRDKNRNAIRSLLVGLSIEDVHQCLVVTGDPVCEEDRSEVRQVYNFNSRKLAGYIRTLNETLLSRPMCVAGALNINALNFDIQLKLAKEKIENGVQMLLTQPVLSERGLTNLKRAYQELDTKILTGIFPVVSARNAIFLANEVSGMYLDERIAPLYEGKSREEGEEIAKEISRRVMEAAAPYTDGWYIMMPFRRTGLVKDLIEIANDIPLQQEQDMVE